MIVDALVKLKKIALKLVVTTWVKPINKGVDFMPQEGAGMLRMKLRVSLRLESNYIMYGMNQYTLLSL